MLETAYITASVASVTAMNKRMHKFFCIGDLGFLEYIPKLDHQFIPYTRINSKWIKDLNISCKSIKVLQENIGSKISDTPCSNIFADMSPRTREIKGKVNKWDYIKLKSFCMDKENISKMKREPTIWENKFVNDTSDKGLISKIYKELT